jgi:outer membrane scaffolding protein for murein synthesis (MipA/OmpV family)
VRIGNGGALRRVAAGLAVAAAALLAGAHPARAQTPSPLQEWQYSEGIILRNMFLPKIPQWHVMVGGAVSTAPLYDGARPYRVQGGPVIDVRYSDLAFLSTGEGLGVNVIRGPNYRAGIAVGFDLGRRVDDYPSHLHGLGNIAAAPMVKLFAEYAISKAFPLVIRAALRRVVGGADGSVGDISIYTPLPGSSRKLVMFAGPSVTFADTDFMQNEFGVNALQSVRSGYPQYRAHAGLKAAGFGFSLTWFVSQHWLVNGDAAVSRLLGSAVQSPITERATTGTVSLTVGYQF